MTGDFLIELILVVAAGASLKAGWVWWVVWCAYFSVRFAVEFGLFCKAGAGEEEEERTEDDHEA